MARARNIKPGFFKNEDLVELPFQDRLLFIGLWTLADREGRLEDRPKRIKMEVFPADDVDVEQSLIRLASTGMLLRYEVENVRYIQIVNFLKHQRPHGQEKASEIPPFQGELQPRSEPLTTKVVTNYNQGDSQHALIPDTPFSDTPFSDTPFSDTPKPQTARKRADVDARFDTWYAAYPNKVGKQKARQAFQKIDWQVVDFDFMMTALEQHKQSEQWTKDGGQFIPHPTTYLNRGGWDDELGPPAASTTEPQSYSADPDEAERQMRRDLEQLKNQSSQSGNGVITMLRREA